MSLVFLKSCVYQPRKVAQLLCCIGPVYQLARGKFGINANRFESGLPSIFTKISEMPSLGIALYCNGG